MADNLPGIVLCLRHKFDLLIHVEMLRKGDKIGAPVQIDPAAVIHAEEVDLTLLVFVPVHADGHGIGRGVDFGAVHLGDTVSPAAGQQVPVLRAVSHIGLGDVDLVSLAGHGKAVDKALHEIDVIVDLKIIVAGDVNGAVVVGDLLFSEGHDAVGVGGLGHTVDGHFGAFQRSAVEGVAVGSGVDQNLVGAFGYGHTHLSSQTVDGFCSHSHRSLTDAGHRSVCIHSGNCIVTAGPRNLGVADVAGRNDRL